jgi:hypothetical protein
MSRSYEYDANVLVVLAIAALAILACVVLVSLGRGGELSEFPPDVPPLDLPEAGQLTAVDVMALQLPVNLVGYHTQSVDETLKRAASAISARDTRIAVLEQRVSDLMSEHPEEPHHERPEDRPAEPFAERSDELFAERPEELFLERPDERPEAVVEVVAAAPEAVSGARESSEEPARQEPEKPVKPW